MKKLIRFTPVEYIIVDTKLKPVSGYYFDNFINKVRHTGGADYAVSKITEQITHATWDLDGVELIELETVKRFEEKHPSPKWQQSNIKQWKVAINTFGELFVPVWGNH